MESREWYLWKSTGVACRSGYEYVSGVEGVKDTAPAPRCCCCSGSFPGGPLILGFSSGARVGAGIGVGVRAGWLALELELEKGAWTWARPPDNS